MRARDMIRLSLSDLRHSLPKFFLSLAALSLTFTLVLSLFCFSASVPGALREKLAPYQSGPIRFDAGRKDFLRYEDLEFFAPRCDLAEYHLYNRGYAQRNQPAYIDSAYLAAASVLCKAGQPPVFPAEESGQAYPVPQYLKNSRLFDLTGRGDGVFWDDSERRLPDGSYCLYPTEALAARLGVGPGDAVTLYVRPGGGGGEPVAIPYTVQGLLPVGLPVAGGAMAYVSPLSAYGEAAAAYTGQAMEEYFLYGYVYGIDRFLSALEDIRGGGYDVTSPYEDVLRDNRQTALLVNVLLAALEAVVLAVSFTILLNSSNLYIDNKRGMIAMDRALGAKGRHIAGILCVQSALTVLLACLAAVAGTFALNGYLKYLLVGILGVVRPEVAFPWYLPVLLFAAAAAVTAFALWAALGRLKRTSISAVLAEGEGGRI